MCDIVPEKPRILALFDVDGTLTIPRGEITAEMRAFMHQLRKKITVGIVGGKIIPVSIFETMNPFGSFSVRHILLRNFFACLFFFFVLFITLDRPGSDLPKQEEQLGAGVVQEFPWNFSQNGLVAYKNGELQEIQTLSKHLGEDNVKRVVNWTLAYLATLDIPIKVNKTKYTMRGAI